MNDKIKQAKADVVISMYEMRAGLIKPNLHNRGEIEDLMRNKYEDISSLMRYNFIDSMIAMIIDTHNISHADLEEALDRYRGAQVINNLKAD